MRKLQKIALPYQVKTAALQYTITAVPFLGKFTAQIDVRLPQALRGRYIIRYAYDTASEIPAENLIKYFAKPDLNTYLAFNCWELIPDREFVVTRLTSRKHSWNILIKEKQ